MSEPSAGQASRRRFLSAVFVTCALLLGGCASTTYDVKVTAQAQAQTKAPRSYRLVDQPVDEKFRPLYQEAIKIVRRALATKGLNELPGPAEPDWLITFNCTVGPPITNRTVGTEAVYVLVPGPVRYETVQVGTSANGTPIYQTVARQEPPTQQLYGYRDFPIDVTSFKKYLRWRAFENKLSGNTAQPQLAWSADATCESGDKDILKILPVLAAASMVYFGKSSDGSELIRIKATDRDVAAIQRGK